MIYTAERDEEKFCPFLSHAVSFYEVWNGGILVRFLEFWETDCKLACSRLSVVGDKRKRAKKNERGLRRGAAAQTETVLSLPSFLALVLPHFFSRSLFFSLPTAESLEQANCKRIPRISEFSRFSLALQDFMQIQILWQLTAYWKFKWPPCGDNIISKWSGSSELNAAITSSRSDLGALSLSISTEFWALTHWVSVDLSS